MALKFVQTGNTGSGSGAGTYDHNLLVNRGLPDQHTIESITGLRDILAKKYEKPFNGIPKEHLAFDVATIHDLDVIRNTDIADLDKRLQSIIDEVVEARGDEDRLKQYIDSKVSYAEWNGSGGSTGGGAGGHMDSQVGYPIFEEHIATDAQVTYLLSKKYRMGTHQLEVYWNGLRMLEGNDYIEVDENTIEFLWPAEKDDRVLFQVKAVINSGMHEEHYATAGQQKFILSTAYGLNQNILQVFRNGVLQRKGRDYKEIDNLTIEFQYPLEVDDYLTFHQAGASDPFTGTIVENEMSRIKTNLGYTTLQLQDTAKSPKTDYKDMYVDSFITNQNIDDEKSFPYEYVDEAISVRQIDKVFTDEDTFSSGTLHKVDTFTYPEELLLEQDSVLSDADNFFAPTIKGAVKAVDTISVLSNRRDKYHIYVKNEDPNYVLACQINMDTEIKLQTTTNYLFGLSADVDSKGNAHIVFHEQPISQGLSKVRYVVINNKGIILHQSILSNQLYNALLPDITIDTDDIAHIAFMSKRINMDYNIDYMYIDSSFVPSGLFNATDTIGFDSINPRIAFNPVNKQIYITFESLQYNASYKNIILAIIKDGIKTDELSITTSSTFENTQSDIAIDDTGRAKIVWRSKRNGTTYGIDYTSVGLDNIATPTKTVSSGIHTCGRPSISIDPTETAHVVFESNYADTITKNICYVRVDADNSVRPLENIASDIASDYVDPFVHAYGDTIIVAFLAEQFAAIVEKDITNFVSLGRYINTIDSKTKDAEWQSVLISSVVPSACDFTVEYRIGNDLLTMSTWKTLAELELDTTTGRYLDLKFTLTSADRKQSPVIYDFTVSYLPSYIEIQSIPKTTTKAVDSAIVIAEHTGEIEFFVSRNNGAEFVDALIDTTANLLTTAFGSDVIIKARISKDAILKGWGILW